MTRDDVFKQLADIKSDAELIDNESDFVEGWINSGIGLEAVEPILRFMEANPLWDFGSPGALVHFVERFYGKGYEELLATSILRLPTAHTAWMLNRIINGEKELDKQRYYVDLLRKAKTRNDIDTGAFNQITRFCALHADVPPPVL